jgi:hypothetical protein
MPSNSSRSDDTPPPEEIELAVEDSIDHPLKGQGAAERLEGINKRIAYLSFEIQKVTSRRPVNIEEFERLTQELDMAIIQRKGWKAQHQGRN